PVETVTPLAKALNLDINTRFENEDFPKLAEGLLTDARYAGKTVLVCWHHGRIPALAQQLKAKDTPDHWRDSVFDQIWVITYKDGKAKFKKRHQALLPGDAKE